MTWLERVQEAAYTPNLSGTRHAFGYGDLSREVDKKAAAFNFPGVDGTYIQDLGHTGRRYPLRVYIWGEDYDLVATSFEDALLERGGGVLEHPAYGTVDVVPFGTITRRDDLKTAANQAVIDVTFWETTGLVYPTATADPRLQTIAAATETEGATALTFGSLAAVSTAVERRLTANTVLRYIGAARETLAAVADVTQATRQVFDRIYTSITLGAVALASDPETLAAQVAAMFRTPAAPVVIASDTVDRVATYATLVEDAVTRPTDTPDAFAVADMVVTLLATNAAVSAVSTNYAARPVAVRQAEVLIDLLDDVTTWRDEQHTALDIIDTGEAYEAMQQTIATAAGHLVETSFTLKQERRVTLDRAHTPLDLLGELFPDEVADDLLDELINNNDLVGTEILEVPRGREIVYYV